MTRQSIRYGSLHTERPPMCEARRLHVFGKLLPLDDDRSGMPKLGAIAWANFACWLIVLIAASCFFLTYGS